MRTVILKLGGYLCDTAEERGEDGRTKIRRKLYLFDVLVLSDAERLGNQVSGSSSLLSLCT